MNKIKSKADAKKVIDNLQIYKAVGGGADNCEILKLYPNGFYGNLQVCITRKGCREFWNGEIGTIDHTDKDTIIDMLYKYRKAYNDLQYQITK